MSEIQKYQQPSQAVSIFSSSEAFANAQRVGQLLASSSIVPKDYQGSLPNCVVALEIAQRTGIGPFEVMQNMDVIHGRPSWKSSYIIARINACGRFTPLEFEFEDRGKKTVEYTQTEWVQGQKRKSTGKIQIEDRACRVVTESIRSGRTLHGPWVSLEMAVKEGWYTKDGSKWQTMPEVMMQYRAASFFGRMNAPDALLGMHTTDEVAEIGHIESSPYGQALPVDHPSQEVDPISEINSQVAVDDSAEKKPKSRKRQPVAQEEEPAQEIISASEEIPETADEAIDEDEDLI